MSDKLTPHQRDNHNKQMFGIGEAFEMLQNDRDALLIKLAAVEAERDEAIALIYRFLDRLAELDTCLYCGETWVADAPDTHTPGCLIPEARAWLVKVEKS
jgi:hypothetical protein